METGLWHRSRHQLAARVEGRGSHPVRSIEKKRDRPSALQRMCCEAYGRSIMLVCDEACMGERTTDGRNLFR